MADNTIANAIKFLKGEEKSLPAAKTEGQVYFAYKNVGTAEKPSYTGAIYIDTPIGGTQNRIKMTANADIADKAFNDSAGLNIRETYLSSLGYTDDGKQTILIKGSGNNQTRIALPIASTTKSGIVTTDAQSFGGTKTFATINSTNLTVTGSSGFNYSGIETATESKARPVWFADSSGNGKPVVNTNFTYNPATQTLSVANLSGTADKANKDNAGYDIRSTYISNIEVDKDNKYKYNFKTPTGMIKNSITVYDEFQKRSIVTATTDWNTLTSTGIYKVQMSAWGDATKMHSPNSYNKDLYNYGILLVFDSVANDGEKRFTQIYIPHYENVAASGSAYKRMHNGSDINTGWLNWHPIARGLHWNELTGKPNYAGSSSAGGAANSAIKLDSSAGSSTQPVYFSGGKPVACTYTLNKSVPADAKFTDTNTWRPLGTTGDTACAGNDSRLSNARPASDVYAWAKASTKPTYSWGEIIGKPSTFTPSNHTHNKLDSLGVIKAETGKTSQSTSGLSMQQAYNNGYPASYGNVLNLNAQGQGQILVSWAGNGSTSASKMYFRGKTDNNTGDWSSWNEVIDSSNIGSQSVNYANSAGSVAWGNISGKPSSFAPSSHEHSYVLDVNNGSHTTFAYSKADMNYGDYTWLAAWNGTELRAVNKSQFATSSHTHPYLPLAGGTMTGTINFTSNKLACNFRPESSGYHTGIMHQTYGSEALVFATTSAFTSFIFKCGQDPTSMTSNTWANITPSMQIIQQSVYINSLIANTVTSGYNLYVNGTTRCNGTLGVGNGSSAEIDFFPNSASTIGARIKAYSDRIEFVFS